MHIAKSLDFLENTVDRNIDVKGVLVRAQKEDSYTEASTVLEIYIYHHEY